MAEMTQEQKVLEEAQLKKKLINQMTEALPLDGDTQAAAIALQVAQANEAALLAQVDSLKAEANRIKSAIAGWKAWFDALLADRQLDETGKLQIEVSRLASSLAELEAQIAPREAEKYALEAMTEVARARLEVLRTEGEEADARIAKTLARKQASAERAVKKAAARVDGTAP